MSWIHPLEPRLLLASFIVTNTNDSGGGSLRDAMQKAENNADNFNSIDFNLPGSGVRTINLNSGLPMQTKQLYINGLSASGRPLIQPIVRGVPSLFPCLFPGSAIRFRHIFRDEDPAGPRAEVLRLPLEGIREAKGRIAARHA